MAEKFAVGDMVQLADPARYTCGGIDHPSLAQRIGMRHGRVKTVYPTAYSTLLRVDVEWEGVPLGPDEARGWTINTSDLERATDRLPLPDLSDVSAVDEWLRSAS